MITWFLELIKLQKTWNNYFFFFEIFESLSFSCLSTSDFLSSTALKTSWINPSRCPSEISGDTDSAMLLIAAEISELTCSKLSGSSAAVAYNVFRLST